MMAEASLDVQRGPSTNSLENVNILFPTNISPLVLATFSEWIVPATIITAAFV